MIWSFGRSYLQSEISASVLWSFSPGQFSSLVRSRFIRGLIELIFGEHVLNSLIFILNGEIGIGVLNSGVYVREQ